MMFQPVTLSVPFDTGEEGSMQIPLYERTELTYWSRDVVSSSRTVLLRDVETLSGKNAINKLSKSHAVIGIAIGTTQSKNVLYLIISPTDRLTEESCIYFVQKYDGITKSMNQKLSISQLSKIYNSDPSHRLNNKHITVGSINRPQISFDLICGYQNPTTKICYDFFQTEFQIMCIEKVSKEVAEINYDFYITGRKKETPLSNVQLNRKKRRLVREESSDEESMIETTKAIKTHSFQIPTRCGEIVCSDVNTEVFKKLIGKGRYGIRVANGGGKVAVIPLVREKYGENKNPVMLSEMHVVRDVEGAFRTEHTISTLITALEALDCKLESRNVPYKEANEIRGAVSATLLNDISWRMVDENNSELMKFKSVGIDIDQTTLTIDKLDYKIFATEKTRFLKYMYDEILENILVGKHLVHEKVSFSSKIYETFCRRGGHTYQSNTTKGRYTRLVTSNRDVFRASVLLHNVTDTKEQEKLVWEAQIRVITFLELHSDRSSAQQRINLKNLNTIGIIYDIYCGHMLPLLTICELASTNVGGIGICLETFNTKVHDTINVPFDKLFDKIIAQQLAEQLSEKLKYSSPFIIHRASQRFQFLSHKSNLSNHLITNSELKLVFGVGGTVETYCELPKQTHEELEPFVSILEINNANSNGKPYASICADTVSDPTISYERGSRDCLENLNNNSWTDDVDDVDNVDEHDTLDDEQDDTGSDNDTRSDNNEEQDDLECDEIACDLDGHFCDNTNETTSMDTLFHEKFDNNADNMVSGESLDHEKFNYKNGYSFIHIEDPPYADLVSDPVKWFIGAEESRSENEEQRKYKEAVCLLKNIVVKTKTHETFSDHGGSLGFKLQPITIQCKKMMKGQYNFVSKSAKRIMIYNVSSRLAFGEYLTKLKCTTQMAHMLFDVVGTSEFCVFNYCKFMERMKIFEDNNIRTMHNVRLNGSPCRIEVAFESPSPKDNIDTLVDGIFDVVTTILTSTKTYDVEPIVKLVRFFLMGVMSKISILACLMGGKDRPTDSTIFDELMKLRQEVGAILHSWYSGKGRLKNPNLASPKNACMACRIILASTIQTPYTEQATNRILRQGQNDYMEIFTSHLIDRNGTPHVRIENPMFVRQFSRSTFTQKFICGKACPKCFRVFGSPQALSGYKTHACTDLIKQEPIDLSNPRFLKHYDEQVSLLKPTQKLLMDFVARDDHDDPMNTNRNMFMTGFAGTGKSFTLMCAIVHALMKHGMHTYAVICPTKVAAGLVNGITFHSFLKIAVSYSNDVDDEEAGQSYVCPEADEPSRARNHYHTFIVNYPELVPYFKYSLKFIFIDECGMLSHDQITFLDYFLRAVRDSNVPFGGIRMILSGDVLQMPPLILQLIANQRRHPVYFFESKSFYESQFTVLYLKDNQRQKGKKNPFADLLNHIRDGKVTLAELEMINNTFGEAVNYEDAYRVCSTLLFAFAKDYDAKKTSSAAFKHANSYAVDKNGLNVKTPFDTLDWRMKSFWNQKHLPEFVKILAKTSVNDNTMQIPASLEEFSTSPQGSEWCEKLFKHINRLKTKSKEPSGNNFSKEDGNNVVISTEHFEIDAISTEYTMARRMSGAISNLCTAKDSVENNANAFTAEMRAFAKQQTKLETVSEFFKGQKLFATVNDIDENVANNQIVQVTDFEYKGTEVEYVIVTPYVQDDTLVSHPIKVRRKIRKLCFKGVNIIREQFPLKPADSGTHFTFQGVTMFTPYIFNNQRTSKTGYGRVYVALSRAKFAWLVFVLHPLSKEDIVADPIALAFDQYHRDKVNANGGCSSATYDDLKLPWQL